MTVPTEKLPDESYYYSGSSGVPTTRLSIPAQNHVRTTEFLTTILANRGVAVATLIAIGLIFKGYDYFLYHGTEAQALIAALIIGAFLWATLSPKRD